MTSISSVHRKLSAKPSAAARDTGDEDEEPAVKRKPGRAASDDEPVSRPEMGEDRKAEIEAERARLREERLKRREERRKKREELMERRQAAQNGAEDEDEEERDILKKKITKKRKRVSGDSIAIRKKKSKVK